MGLLIPLAEDKSQRRRHRTQDNVNVGVKFFVQNSPNWVKGCVHSDWSEMADPPFVVMLGVCNELQRHRQSRENVNGGVKFRIHNRHNRVKVGDW